MPNPYYDPQDLGLTAVGEIEWSEPCYDFDLTGVWRDAAGTFYWADDSGCSCPAPFEGYTDLSDLTSGTFHELAEHLQQRSTDHGAPQVVELLARIRSAVA